MFDGKYSGYDPDFRIDEKIAVITGGAMGLGNAIAKLFYAKGAKIALFDIQDNIDEIAKEIGPDVIGVKMDVTRLDDIDRALDLVVKHFGEINILCNVAGIGQLTPAVDIAEEDFDRIVAVNFKGLFFMAQRVGRIMIAQGKGGKVINMSSQAGQIGLPNHATYAPTKAAVTNLTKVLAGEWGKHWINVNAISPTITRSPMADLIWGGEKGEAYLEKQPLHRFAEAPEIAACALFLASEASNMITGENLVIDGGYSIV